MSCLPGCKRVRNHRGNCNNKEPLKIRYRMIPVGESLAQPEERFRGIDGLKSIIVVGKLTRTYTAICP